jgi:drug/metabolite transporter (DMT)-like permease
MWSTDKLNWGLVKQCLVPALLSTAGQVFWSLAHYELQASEIGFFARMSTAWAILGSMVLFHDERRLVTRPRFLMGLAIIAAGFLVMSWIPAKPYASGGTNYHEATMQPAQTLWETPSTEHPSTRVGTNRDTNMDTRRDSNVLPGGNYRLGVAFALLASCFFGTYMVSIRWYVPHENPIHVFGVVSQFVSVGMVIGMFACGEVTSVTQQTTFSWSLIVASSIMGIGFGHVLVYTAVQRLGASITTSCQSVLPFLTVAVAALTLSERLAAQQWFGGLMMIVGALTLLSIKHEITVAKSQRPFPKSV